MWILPRTGKLHVYVSNLLLSLPVLGCKTKMAIRWQQRLTVEKTNLTLHCPLLIIWTLAGRCGSYLLLISTIHFCVLPQMEVNCTAISKTSDTLLIIYTISEKIWFNGCFKFKVVTPEHFIYIDSKILFVVFNPLSPCY